MKTTPSAERRGSENLIENETLVDSGKIEENEVVIGVENDAEVQTAGGRT